MFSLPPLSRISSLFLVLILVASPAFAESVEGDLRLVIEDSLDEGAEEYLLLETGSEIVELLVSDQELEQIASSDLLNQRITAEVEPVAALQTSPRPFELKRVTNLQPVFAAQAQAPVTAPRVVNHLAVVVNIHPISGTNLSAGITPAALESLVFSSSTSMRNMLLDASQGQFVVQGTVAEVTITPDEVSSCAWTTWASLARQKLIEQGVDVASYEKTGYKLPSAVPCPWAGIAFIGGSYFADKEGTRRVWIHEFGHNLGSHHASTDFNNDNTIDSEYGDDSDPMGLRGGGRAKPHGINRKFWNLNSENYQHLTLDTNTAVTQTLASHDKDPISNTPSTIEYTPNTGGRPYFFTYRRSDSPHSTNIPTRNLDKLNIHRTRGFYSQSLLIANLGEGEEFTDATVGLTVRVASINGDTMVLEINGGMPDTDDDGVSDSLDCALSDNTRWQDEAYPDPDRDGVRNATSLSTVACFGDTPPTGFTLAMNGPDNCPNLANPSQEDLDRNGIGDACEVRPNPPSNLRAR